MANTFMLNSRVRVVKERTPLIAEFHTQRGQIGSGSPVRKMRPHDYHDAPHSFIQLSLYDDYRIAGLLVQKRCDWRKLNQTYSEPWRVSVHYESRSWKRFNNWWRMIRESGTDWVIVPMLVLLPWFSTKSINIWIGTVSWRQNRSNLVGESAVTQGLHVYQKRPHA